MGLIENTIEASVRSVRAFVRQYLVRFPSMLLLVHHIASFCAGCFRPHTSLSRLRSAQPILRPSMSAIAHTFVSPVSGLCCWGGALLSGRFLCNVAGGDHRDGAQQHHHLRRALHLLHAGRPRHQRAGCTPICLLPAAKFSRSNSRNQHFESRPLHSWSYHAALSLSQRLRNQAAAVCPAGEKARLAALEHVRGHKTGLERLLAQTSELQAQVLLSSDHHLTLSCVINDPRLMEADACAPLCLATSCPPQYPT